MAGRVAVTGAGGFIGRALLPALAGTGAPITLLVNQTTPTLPPGADVQAVQLGDLAEAPGLAEALEGCETVIHLAGRAHRAKPGEADRLDLQIKANTEATARLAEAASAAGVRNLLLVSSIAVLGNETRPGEPFVAASPTAPVNDYGFAKLRGEIAARAAFQGEGRSLLVLRPPLVVGPGAPGNLATLTRLLATKAPTPFGATRNPRSLVSVEGVVAAILAALERWRAGPASGAYVLADAAPLELREIVAAIGEGLGGIGPLVPVPDWVLERSLWVAGKVDLARQLLSRLEVDAADYARDFPWTPVSDSRPALRALGAAAAR